MYIFAMLLALSLANLWTFMYVNMYKCMCMYWVCVTVCACVVCMKISAVEESLSWDLYPDLICRIYKLETHCNTLQHTSSRGNTWQHTVTNCKTLQRAGTHCNTLQHTATHCNTLQHAGTHCNTLDASMSLNCLHAQGQGGSVSTHHSEVKIALLLLVKKWCSSFVWTSQGAVSYAHRSERLWFADCRHIFYVSQKKRHVKRKKQLVQIIETRSTACS